MPHMGMLVHTYNPSIERWRQEIQEFEVILGKIKATLVYMTLGDKTTSRQG